MQGEAVGAVPLCLGEQAGADAGPAGVRAEVEVFEQIAPHGGVAEELGPTGGDDGVTLRQHDLPDPAGDLVMGAALRRQVGHGRPP